MDELLKILEKRLENLQKGYEKQIADIHAQEGAIQECAFTINQIKEKISKSEV